MNIKTTLTALWKSDARLTATSLVMIALLAATGVALMLDPRQITGAPAWLKPAKFAMSIAIYTLTLAWVFMYLPDWPRTRRVVSWVTTVTLLLEIVIIDVQAWRGTTSHFNVGTLGRRHPVYHHGSGDRRPDGCCHRGWRSPYGASTSPTGPWDGRCAWV